MAYGITEFPGTNMYESDLNELIRLYRETSGRYDETLSRLADLERIWDTIDGKIDAAVLVGVQNATKVIIAEVNGMIDDLSKKVDGQLADSAAQVKALTDHLNATIVSLNARMDKIDNATDEALKALAEATAQVDDKIESEIGKYNGGIQESIAAITNGVWDEITRLSDRLDNIVDQYPDVRNPITGIYQALNDVLDEMWYWMRVYGLTALEYDSLGLTAAQYDDLGLTAMQYDYFGKLYLYDWLHRLTLSPVTGAQTEIKEALYQIDRNFAVNAYTAQLYDELGLTAEQLDGIGATAYEWDYYGAPLLCRASDKDMAYKIAPRTYQFVRTKTMEQGSEDSNFSIELLDSAGNIVEAKIKSVYMWSVTAKDVDGGAIVPVSYDLNGNVLSISGLPADSSYDVTVNMQFEIEED